MSATRRVLMTADAVGGVFTYALALTRYLASQSVETVLAVLGPPPSASQRRLLAAVPGLTLVTHEGKLEWMDEPWSDVDASGEFLLQLEARFGPDIVHLNGFAHGALPFKARKLVVAHSCVLSWWRAVKREPAPARYAPYRRRVRAGLQAANHVIAPTHAMLGQLQTLYGPLPHTEVIHNGLDAPRLRSAPSERVHAREPRILAAGRVWDEAKNLSTLDRVVSRVAWPIEVAGEMRAPGFELPALLGPACHAARLGQLTSADLFARLSRSAIFAAPARYEPFGLGILEAAHAGCALVLADIESLRELWSEAALFVPLDDDERLVRALGLLIDDASLRGQLSLAARARARRYTTARFGAAYLQAYQAMRGASRTRAAARTIHHTELR